MSGAGRTPTSRRAPEPRERFRHPVAPRTGGGVRRPLVAGGLRARQVRAPLVGGAVDHYPNDASPHGGWGNSRDHRGRMWRRGLPGPGDHGPDRGRAGHGGAGHGRPDPMAALVEAAKAEGGLTTIALPRTWCNYGDLIDGYTRASTASRSTASTPMAAPSRRSTPSRPIRAAPGRRPPTSSTSASHSVPRASPRSLRAIQGLDLGQHPRLGEGRRRLLVRRLLRRARLRDEHRRAARRTDRLGRPARSQVRGPGRSRRQPGQVEPGHLGRVGSRLRQRRRWRRRLEGPRLLQATQRQGQLRARHRQRGDGRRGRDPGPHHLDLQRPCRQGFQRRHRQHRGRRA